jgi:hypothetical protein
MLQRGEARCDECLVWVGKLKTGYAAAAKVLNSGCSRMAALADLPKVRRLGCPLHGERLQHPRERDVTALPSFENGLDDGRLKLRQAQDTGHVGWRDPFTFGQFVTAR